MCHSVSDGRAPTRVYAPALGTRKQFGQLEEWSVVQLCPELVQITLKEHSSENTYVVHFKLQAGQDETLLGTEFMQLLPSSGNLSL